MTRWSECRAESPDENSCFKRSICARWMEDEAFTWCASLEFHSIKLEFVEIGITNVFAKKNNRTLGETFEHRRYAPLLVEMHGRYPNSLNRKLREFLHELKLASDPVYRKFLNKSSPSACFLARLLLGNSLPPKPVFQIFFNLTDCTTLHRAKTYVITVRRQSLLFWRRALH